MIRRRSAFDARVPCGERTIGNNVPSATAGLRLVVTADDFGIGAATSAGIVDAHLHGPVTSTSVMTVTGDHLRRSVGMLGAAPRLELGLHLVLTDAGERPLAATRASGLVGRDGRFHTNGRLWMRAWAGLVDPRGVLDEVAAQADAFRRELGRLPAYFDGHHHSHQLPGAREAVARAVALGLLPPLTRVTVEPSPHRARFGEVRAKRLAAHVLGTTAQAVFRRAGLRTNDGFTGMLAETSLDRPFPWEDAMDALPSAGVIEWVVHPGRPDDTLAGRDPYVAGRVAELRALTDPTRRHHWDRPGVRLSTKAAALG